MREVQHWNKLLREIVETLSLEIFNWTSKPEQNSLKLFLCWAGVRTTRPPEVPANPDLFDSKLLLFCCGTNAHHFVAPVPSERSPSGFLYARTDFSLSHKCYSVTIVYYPFGDSPCLMLKYTSGEFSVPEYEVCILQETEQVRKTRKLVESWCLVKCLIFWGRGID